MKLLPVHGGGKCFNGGMDMAEKQTSSRRSANSGRQAPPRRNDVIRCENCGEDYSVTYKRCPFCDERPGSRGGVYVGGKRVANKRGGGYGGPINPIQIIWLVISLVLIIVALFIVFRFFSSAIFGGGGGSSTGQNSSVSTGQVDGSTGQSGNTSQSDGSGTPSGESGDGSQSDQVAAQSITLDLSDFTLPYRGTQQITATVTPTDTTQTVVWTSSQPDVASVDETGLVTNNNSGSSLANVTITATCGDVSAQCVVRCSAQSSSGSTTGNTGTIVNAEQGLNIRSGPGTEYEKVASAQNGASVAILGEENGWYRIDYGGGRIGYVLKDYVSVNG